MGILICPVCGEKLELSDKTFICPNRHCFDKAKSGYVNLLLSKQTGKTVHGDNKLMVQARRDFLDKGFYSPLKNALCKKAEEYFSGGVILDAGCGEGYYTESVSETVPDAEIIGIDISKTAADYSAKRCKKVQFAAASVFHLPVADESVDMILTLFAPYSGEEFLRVLKKNGIMIMVIPSENHLWELKKAVYDTPYKNQVKPYELEGFQFVEAVRISDRIHLESQEDIQSLFSMTPYYYRTGKIQQERLAALSELETETDFEILIYRK